MSSDLGGFSLMELFRTEAESQTAVLSEGVLRLERGALDAATVEALMRAAHSLKGAARIVGLDAAVRVAHALEDYFVAAQKGAVQPQPAHVDVLLRGIDLLTQIAHLTDAESAAWLAENEPALARYTEQLQALPSSAPPAPPAAPAPTPPPVEAAPAPPAPEPPRPAEEPAKKPAAPAGVERTERVIRVTADSFTRLLGLAGESLVEVRQLRPVLAALRELKQTQAGLYETLRLLEEAGGGGAGLLARALEQAARSETLTSDNLQALEDFVRRGEDLAGRLHHEVIVSRMRPFAEGVRGFPRMVRDLARQLGKEVAFEIRGEDTGVDRDILEKLEAPLTHLLRNALDHGLEAPAERQAVGKSPAGSVVLEATHRAGMLQITLRDDGRGIDVERLRRKVVAQGHVSPAMAEQLSDAELYEFLFLPGFTTKEAVTEVSGRGVGLDVVLSMVRAVGGSVRIGSVFGQETCFTLRVPISRSIIRALLVEIAGEPYAFPLTRIDRIELLPADRVQWLEGKAYFTLDGQHVGLVEATQVLDLPDDATNHRQAYPVVVLSDRGYRYGLIVQRFAGETDLDVRPLDPLLGKVPNLGSASVLEDGSPVLIFDVEDLVSSIDSLVSGRRLRRRPTAGAGRPQTRRVLVVDDSLTVRELERQLLHNSGYEVDVAVDGMEGWNAVRTGAYALVVSDVDMPRMDGIELVRHIRQDSRLKGLPVVIVSYKDREEDRLRGLDAGATCYLTKSSFHDQTFLQTVRDLIGEAQT